MSDSFKLAFGCALVVGAGDSIYHHFKNDANKLYQSKTTDKKVTEGFQRGTYTALKCLLFYALLRRFGDNPELVDQSVCPVIENVLDSKN